MLLRRTRSEWKSSIPETMEASGYLARYIDRLSSCYSDNSGDVGVPISSAETVSGEMRVLTNPTDVYSTLAERDEDYPEIIYLLWSVSIERPLDVPNKLDKFVVERIIPYFNCQRKANYLQFAVVLFLSESDLADIMQTRFTPSDPFTWRPIVNNSFSLMPQDPANYGNYITARPSNKYHSEVKLFEQCSDLTDTPFYHLWRSYVKQNGDYPECVLIYSWNLPCSHCTDVIIKSLAKEPYSRVNVVVAHTAVWGKEKAAEHETNKRKFKSKNITVKQIPYSVHLQPVPLSM